MNNTVEFIQNNISVFDLIVVLITIYYMAQCAAKGFTISLLSFSKWILSLVITIILVPKLNLFVQDYIESNLVADVGLGIFIFIVALFVIINIGKVIGSAVTWSGLGTVDKTFGLIFGLFKGYVVCVCIFTLVNWFYPHQKWPFNTKNAYSFEIIYNGSEFLVKEFPNNKDYYKESEELIEKI